MGQGGVFAVCVCLYVCVCSAGVFGGLKGCLIGPSHHPHLSLSVSLCLSLSPCLSLIPLSLSLLSLSLSLSVSLSLSLSLSLYSISLSLLCMSDGQRGCSRLHIWTVGMRLDRQPASIRPHALFISLLSPPLPSALFPPLYQIGRASCRERV